MKNDFTMEMTNYTLDNAVRSIKKSLFIELKFEFRKERNSENELLKGYTMGSIACTLRTLKEIRQNERRRYLVS